MQRIRFYLRLFFNLSLTIRRYHPLFFCFYRYLTEVYDIFRHVSSPLLFVLIQKQTKPFNAYTGSSWTSVHGMRVYLWHCIYFFIVSKKLLRHLRKFHNFTKLVRRNAGLKFYGNEASLQNHISHGSLLFPQECEKKLIGNPCHKWQNFFHHLILISKLEVQQKGTEPMSFILNNHVKIASFIDREITNQSILRVDLCFQLILPKPLDRDFVSPNISQHFKYLKWSLSTTNILMDCWIKFRGNSVFSPLAF